ncbi:hypothetical protein [Paraburkholderia sp. C35]|uniref:hypothetical protein n=1 Tax=Paraburkholderia sp. C35 TaxID=2126993 RepID=UPI00194FAF82|nr:hypothetical protein [Paraburkholderia sp. C35]
MKRSQLSTARVMHWVRSAALPAVLVMTGALAACSSAPPLFGPGGQPTTLVQCPAGSDNCEQQAQAACGGAFDTMRSTTDNGTRSLLYACRAK